MTTQCSPKDQSRIAVLIPCYNESATIASVVSDFREQLPSADIYVYDNNSTDNTAALASAAGATVVVEKRQGKGFVLQTMVRDIDADYYVLVDGDDTYPANRVHDLLAPLRAGRADMVIGTRLTHFEEKSFRKLHMFGNRLVVGTINVIFRTQLSDVMSGYRAFTRNLARSVPVVSRGFEIETEWTLQALYRNMVLSEVPVHYRERPEGSVSKLRTFHDGFRVLVKIFDLFKSYRPMMFFSLTGIIIALVGIIVGSIPTLEFLQTGKILHFPSAILAASLEMIAVVSFTCGIILDSINHHFRELAQLIVNLDCRDGGSVQRGLDQKGR
jgi:glycosyltransferase involved in cell wall biosynthesis